MMEESNDVEMDENDMAFEPETLISEQQKEELPGESTIGEDGEVEAKRARFEEESSEVAPPAEESMPTSCGSDWTQEENNAEPPPPPPASVNAEPASPVVSNSRPISRNSSAASQLSRVGSRVTTIAQSLCLTDLFEYQWPAEDFTMSERSGPSRVSTPIVTTGPDKPEPDWYMVQELISECLKIKSFKRKYPDLTRRTIDAWERQYLTQKGLIAALGTGQADLGLTALRSEEVMAIIEKDHPESHSAVSQILQQRRIQSISDKQKAQYQTSRVLDRGTRLEQHRKRALKSVAEFNRNLLAERRNERLYYWDMATFQIHVQQRSVPKPPDGLPPAMPIGNPANKEVPLETPEAVRQLTLQRPGHNQLRDEYRTDGVFPLAIIPGQYSHYYKHYTAHELGYMPIGRTIYTRATNKELDDSLLDSSKLSPKRPVTAEPNTPGANGGETAALSPAAASGTPAASNTLDGSMLDENSQTSILNPEEEGTSDTAISAPLPIDCTVCGQEAQDPVRCSDCPKAGHVRCMELPEHMREAVRTYSWSCMDCKKCVECLDPGHEDLMMFCDRCDRGYHAFCVGLEAIPEGNWDCPSCTPDNPEDDLPLAKVKRTVRHKRSKRALPTTVLAAVSGDSQG